MAHFNDAILPITIRFESATGIDFQHQELFLRSGFHKVNEVWDEPLRRFRLVYKRPIVDGVILSQFYEALGGPADSFLVRDWAFWHTATDEDSRPSGSAGIANTDAPLINTTTNNNQADGSTLTFQCHVTRTAGSASRTFRIRHPVSAGFVCAFDGQDCTSFISSVNETTGVVTFTEPPPFGGSPNNALMTWGSTFYRAAHFTGQFEEVLRNFEINWFQLELLEAKGA